MAKARAKFRIWIFLGCILVLCSFFWAFYDSHHLYDRVVTEGWWVGAGGLK